jgi:DegV family protein with EDD domain
MVAQSMLKEKDPAVHVEVIDTRNVSLCQGWMAIEAARAALAGLRLEEVVAKVKRMVPITHMLQTADTLKYLYMGGRIGKATNLLGSLLNIKPLIGMEDGEIVPLGVARGRGHAYQAIANKVEASLGKGKARIAYVHAGAKQEVERLKGMVEDKVEVVESIIAELSPALAVHSGPGTAGLCYSAVEQ